MFEFSNNFKIDLGLTSGIEFNFLFWLSKDGMRIFNLLDSIFLIKIHEKPDR